MNVLLLDTSSQSGSCAIYSQDKLIAEVYLNNGSTHSKTALPMIECAMREANMQSIAQIDLMVVSTGPGSFTGLRIGLSTVKGLAFRYNTPCVSVSTLEGLANNMRFADAIILPVLDARRDQVYSAFFRSSEGKINRLTADCCITLKQLAKQIESDFKFERIILLGDGAKMCAEKMDTSSFNLSLAPENLLYQRACSFLPAALEKLAACGTQPACELSPSYCRIPQAERERLETQ